MLLVGCSIDFNWSSFWFLDVSGGGEFASHLFISMCVFVLDWVGCLKGVVCVVHRVGNLRYQFGEWLFLVLFYGRDFAP